MKFVHWSAIAAAVALAATGCGRPKVTVRGAPPTPVAKPIAETMTLETSRLGEAVDNYARAQNPENDAAVRQAMAQLDSEIAHLEDLIAKRQGKQREEAGARMRHLFAFRSAETTRFAAIQAGVPTAPLAAPSTATQVEIPATPASHMAGDAAR